MKNGRFTFPIGKLESLKITNEEQRQEIQEARNALEAAVQQMRESEERYRTLVELTPEPVLVHMCGKILYVNAAAIKIFGARNAQDLIGKMTTDLVHPEFRAQQTSRMHSIIGQQQIKPMVESRFLRLDGTPFDVEVQGTAITYDGEAAIHVSLRDISQRKQAESALAASEERWKLALESTGDGMWDLQVQTGEEYLSRNLLRMYGFEEGDLIPTMEERDRQTHPDDVSRVQKDREAHLAGLTATYSNEHRVRCKDGSWKWVLSRGMVINRDQQGRPLRMIGTHTDISERKSAEGRLLLAASVFTYAREGIAITDASGTIMEVNDTFSVITGYSREEVVGRHPSMLISDVLRTEFYTSLWHSLSANGHWSGEVWNRRRNNEEYDALLTISAVRDDEGRTLNYVALFSDITSTKEHQRRLERMAHYDTLTGLPNRLLFADRLHHAMLQSHRRGRMVAVAYLDLDGFKEVNDNHGHDVGDALLVALAECMKTALREGDTLARLGGDEFVAVLADLETPAACEPVVERLLLATSQSIAVRDKSLKVSASIGIALYPRDASDADLLLRRADQAMYVAKGEGKSRFHLFDSRQAAAVQTQREFVAQIRHALENDEFVLHYQPKVNMKTNAVVGVEALIRWEHPQRGLLAPAQFLLQIEGHPISLDLGEWVINSALKQIDAWRTLGLVIPVSVNISAYQLQHISFVECLSIALAAHPEVHHSQLQLEILETSALDNVDQGSAQMHACLALGVSFALDDFGTGYSSLSHLKHLPATLLKIDQSFVRDMLIDPDDMAIVQGVIGLANAFKLEVIAEGVETRAHATQLLAMGCELAQGYGIARPMRAKDVPNWMATWHAHPVWA